MDQVIIIITAILINDITLLTRLLTLTYLYSSISRISVLLLQYNITSNDRAMNCNVAILFDNETDTILADCPQKLVFEDMPVKNIPQVSDYNT